VPIGVRLDLGATAKALAADRAAAAAAELAGCGVLVSLGGDIAVAGAGPAEGWTIGLADSHLDEPEPGQSVRIGDGGLATSSTTVRRWLRGGEIVHHLIDPRTGRPAREVWRTVTVAAATCVDANTASTAAIVRGEVAVDWLASLGVPARLVRADGRIVRTPTWPRPEVAA
jgi:thiamine biosynthesis lipoprotein